MPTDAHRPAFPVPRGHSQSPFCPAASLPPHRRAERKLPPPAPALRSSPRLLFQSAFPWPLPRASCLLSSSPRPVPDAKHLKVLAPPSCRAAHIFHPGVFFPCAHSPPVGSFAQKVPRAAACSGRTYPAPPHSGSRFSASAVLSESPQSPSAQSGFHRAR